MESERLFVKMNNPVSVTRSNVSHDDSNSGSGESMAKHKSFDAGFDAVPYRRRKMRAAEPHNESDKMRGLLALVVAFVVALIIHVMW